MEESSRLGSYVSGGGGQVSESESDGYGYGYGHPCVYTVSGFSSRCSVPRMEDKAEEREPAAAGLNFDADMEVLTELGVSRALMLVWQRERRNKFRHEEGRAIKHVR